MPLEFDIGKLFGGLFDSGAVADDGVGAIDTPEISVKKPSKVKLGFSSEDDEEIEITPGVTASARMDAIVKKLLANRDLTLSDLLGASTGVSDDGT